MDDGELSETLTAFGVDLQVDWVWGTDSDGDDFIEFRANYLGTRNYAIGQTYYDLHGDTQWFAKAMSGERDRRVEAVEHGVDQLGWYFGAANGWVARQR